jgi:V8-like Glu-specific endopeptidase
MKARRLGILLMLTVLVAMVIGSLVPLVAAQPPPEGPGDVEEVPVAADPSYIPSDSPWLWLPEDERNWPPMEPIGPAEAVEVDDPDAIEVYDIAAGEVIIIPSNGEGQPVDESALSVPPFEGLLPSDTAPESVLPPDDRVRVTATTSFPWRSIVKLRMTFPDNATGGCSGAIIGCDSRGFHVLTAGHCVYSHSNRGWARSVQVIPGYDNGYMPYGSAWATKLQSPTGWTTSGSTKYDWALINLDRNIGRYTGYMGRMTASAGSSIYTGNLHVAGYPGDLCSGNCMYYDMDRGHSADEHNHWYRMDTFGGMSGSAVYRKVGDDRWILTVHTCGTGGCGIAGKGVNHGTRLNSATFNSINTACRADTPPRDRPDLVDDGQSDSGFRPTTVTRGVTSFNVYCDVRNIGTAASGSFRVAYYASTDTTISTSDRLIGTDVVSSIAPFQARDSSWTGTFPASIPNGRYWVGWIIDSGRTVSEFDETNNIARKTAYQLTVTGATGNLPPTNGTITPNSGGAPAGRSIYFTSTYFDPNGERDLKACRLHIGRWAAPKSLAGNAVVLYQARTNKLLIRNDRGTRWWGGRLVGSANVVQNSQVKVYCNLTSVRRAGNMIEVRWALEFKPAFRGRTRMYLKARDLGGLTSPLEQKGTWTVQ